MNTVLAELPPYIDPTAGMELTTGDEIALEATRWLWLGMDLLDPSRKADVLYLREGNGGEELDNICLRRTRGFLPRCTFTPLEVWAEWLPIEFFPEGARPLKLKGAPIQDQNPTGRTLVGKPLYGYAHYPGEQILDAIGLPTGDRRGVVEIEVLRGVNVDDPQAVKLQNLFFPLGQKLPLELRAIEEQIQRTADAHKSDDVRITAKNMLESTAQSRRWAEQLISRQHSQLDARITHHYVHSYSPKCLHLMKQLEMTPRSVGTNPVEAMFKAMNAQGLTPEVLAQMEARDASLVDKLGAAFSEALTKAFSAIQPPPPPTPKGGK